MATDSNLGCLSCYIVELMCFFFYLLFSGGAVPEEKPEDAGHFDPLCHSPCSNHYPFRNKVQVNHSSVFVSVCLGVCRVVCGFRALLDSAWNRQKEFIIPPSAFWAEWRCFPAASCWAKEAIFRLKQESPPKLTYLCVNERKNMFVVGVPTLNKRLTVRSALSLNSVFDPLKKMQWEHF